MLLWTNTSSGAVVIFNVRWKYWRSVSSNWWLNPARWLLNCGSWIRVSSSSNPSSYLPSFQRDLTTFLLSHYSQKHFLHFLPWYHQATSRWSQQKILCNYWISQTKISWNYLNQPNLWPSPWFVLKPPFNLSTPHPHTPGTWWRWWWSYIFHWTPWRW